MALKSRKISKDEALNMRRDHFKDTPKGEAILKAATGPTSWDPETRTGRFTMTTAQTDRYGDIVVTEGIDTKEFERNPVAPFCHNTRTWPVGTWANLEKILKGRPPRMEGDLVVLPAGGPVPEVDMLAWMIENKAIRACSIGFLPIWASVEYIWDDEEEWITGLRFNECELLECSPCVVPANPGALAKALTDGNMRLAKELLEETLDGWRKTPEGLILPRAEFEKQYRLVVEKIGTTAPPKLPVTDDEKVDAEIRAAEFEVGRLIIPAAGMTCAVEGDGLALHLHVEDGAWKFQHKINVDYVHHVHAVVECSVANDKRTFKVAKECAAIGKRWARGAEGWAEADVGPKKDEVEKDQVKVGGVELSTLEINIDTTQAEGALTKLKNLAGEIATQIKGIVTNTKTVEQAAETPEKVVEVPTPEAIEAAKAKVTETMQRLRENKRV